MSDCLIIFLGFLRLVQFDILNLEIVFFWVSEKEWKECSGSAFLATLLGYMVFLGDRLERVCLSIVFWVMCFTLAVCGSISCWLIFGLNMNVGVCLS